MASMNAVVLHRFGGAEALNFETIELPSAKAREVLVRSTSTSVNPVDFKIRNGDVPGFADKLPYVLGRDAAGIVERVGADVSSFKIGDEVFGMPGFDRGTYAEFVILHENELAVAPRRLGLADAGAVPLAALTAWQGLMEHGKLEKGQAVLIHGGAGGVGHFGIQIARAAGATVITTASAKDRAFLIELGADEVIDYKTSPFNDRKDIDLVFDLIGGETQRRSWGVLKEGGTVISTVEDPDPELAAAHKARAGKRYMATPSRDNLTEIASLINTGQIKVEIARRYPLNQIAVAQSVLEDGGVRGKILIDIQVG